MPAAFYLPETDLEVIIRSGGGQKDSRKRIYAKYTEGKSTDEIIVFLKKEYSQVGKGFELHGHPISVWFDENGMTAGYPMRRKTPCFSYGDIRRVHRIYASN